MKESIEGFIVEIDQENAKVKLNRHSDCSLCGNCGGDNALIIDAYNKINAKIGQKVTIEIEKDNGLKASFMVYILPMVAIVAGIVIGELVARHLKLPNAITDILGVGIFFVAFISLVIRYDKSVGRKHKLPIINKFVDYR